MFDYKKMFSEIKNEKRKNNTVVQSSSSAKKTDTVFSEQTKTARFEKSMQKKYSGKSLADIDSIISTYAAPKNREELDEYDWLKSHRDSFMSTDEILSEIDSLEAKSADLKKDKWKSGIEFVGTGLSGQDTESLYNAYKRSKNADTENKARLQKLYDLAASREDFDAEKAYKEADEHNIFDVLKPDYTMADYRNDQSKKNVYGAAVIEKRDSENMAVINADKELRADLEKYFSLKSGSSVGGNAMGGNVITSGIANKYKNTDVDFDALYETFSRYKNAENTEKLNSKINKFAEKAPVLSNAAAVVTNVFGGGPALVESAYAKVKDLLSDDVVSLDVNSPGWVLKNATDEIRDTTSSMIAENNDGIKGEFYNFLYQTGMSMADMGASFVASGFNPSVYPIIMSSNAAADKIKTVTENGGGIDEALLSGLMAGAFEAVFEKVGIDKLVETVTSSAGKSVFKTFLNGFLSEGLEELGTDIANSVSDALINGENSELNNSIYAYMQNGYSANEANAMALTDLAKQYMTSFAGGALSGGIIGGVGGGINKTRYNSQLRDIGKTINEAGNTQELIDYANESDAEYDTEKVSKLYENSSVAQRLREIAIEEAQEKAQAESDALSAAENATAEKYNNGAVNASIEDAKKKLGIGQRITDRRSNYATGKLYADVQNNIGDTATANVKSAVMQKLTENGIDNVNAQKYTDLILKFSNEGLSDSEMRVLRNNTLALNLAQELKDGNAEWYNEAIMPSFISRIRTEAFTQKNENPQTADATVQADEPAAKTNNPAEQVISDSGVADERTYSERATKTLDSLLERATGDNEQAIRDLFDEYYTAGTLGVADVNAVEQTLKDADIDTQLSNDIKSYALAEGNADYFNSAQTSPASKVNKGGVTNRERAVNELKMSSEAVDFIDIVSKKLGVSVQINPEVVVAGGQAKGKYHNGTIYLSAELLKGESDIYAVFTHELTHHLQEIAPEQYRNYKKFVIENIKKHPEKYSEILGRLKLNYRQVQENILDMAIMDEIAADSMELFFGDTEFVQEAIDNDRSFVEKVLDAIKRFLDAIKESIKGLGTNESSILLKSALVQQQNFEQGVDLVEKMLGAGAETVVNAEKTNDTENKYTARTDGEGASEPKYSLNGTKTIYPGMSDTERAEVLKNTKISVAKYEGNNELNGKNVLLLKSSYNSQAGDILKKLGEKFEVFKKYSNENIELEFDYSRGSLNESVHKQGDISTNFYDFAKMLYVFDDVVKNAVPIEVHTDKYEGTKRANPNLKYDYVLLSAFGDGEYIIPVEFHIKEYVDTRKADNKLYVSITLGKIKIENKVKVHRLNVQNEHQGDNTRLFSKISIPQLIEKINPEYGNFYKYIPSELLDNEQIKSKKVAVDDEAYRLAVMRDEDVSEILSRKALEKGYDTDTSWRMDHKAPNAKYDVCITDIDRCYGGDGSIYSVRAAHYYGDGRSYDQKAINAIKKARNSPDALISIYRAVPTAVKDSRVRNGDWVTIVKDYAEEHGWRMFDDDYRIIENKVPAKYLFTDGNSIHEFGYDNGNYNEIYKNAENNVKLNEVTYNDRGEIIPLSQRFDESKDDIRYLLDSDTVREAEYIGNIEGNMFDTEVTIMADRMAENLHKIVQGRDLSKAEFQKTAKTFIYRYNSFMSVAELSKKLESLVDYIKNKNPDVKSLQDACFSIAKQVIEKTDYRDDALYNEYQELRRDISRRKFYVNAQDMSRDDIRQAATLAKRRFYITTDPNQRSEKVRDIDDYYDELRNNHPDFFPETTSPSEQLENIATFLDATAVKVRNLYDTGEMGMSSAEAARLLGGELYHTLATAVNDLYGTKESRRVAALYYETLERFKEQRINQNKSFIEFAKQKDTQVAQYRELAYQQIEEKKAELRDSAERRQTIDQLKRLYSSSIKLLNGSRSDKMGVPPEFKKAFVDVLELVNLATYYYKDHTSKYDAKAEDTRNRLVELKRQLDNLAEELNGDNCEVVSEFVCSSMGDLIKVTEKGKKSITKMKLDELKVLINAIEHIKGLITNNNKMFSEKLDRKRDEYGQSVISELLASNHKKSFLKDTPLSAVPSTLVTNQMMPIYFFENIGGTLEELYKNVMHTEEKQSDIMNEAVAKANGIMNKYHFAKWAFDTPAKEYQINGQYIKIELFEAMSLYAIAKREKGNTGGLSETSHLLTGGITIKKANESIFNKFADKHLKKKDIENNSSANIAVKLDEADINSITSTLTDEQKKFADEMVGYLSKDLAKVGNEASRRMYNHNIFNEDYYFPMKVDDNYLASNPDKRQSKQSKNSSFTKPLSLGSNAPVAISNFMDVWINHVSGMSVYAASAPALNDFMRVYNYKDGANTVKGLIKERYGDDCDEYISKLIEDLNGGYRTEYGGELSEKLIKNMKTAAVSSSISCAIQQSSAIGRAYAYLGVNKTRSATKQGYEEMMKYSALARIKNKSGYDTMSGTSLMYEMMYGDAHYTEKVKMFFENLKHKETRKLSKETLEQIGFLLPGVMDKMTWSAIWNTCKAQIRSKKQYEYESPEFFNAVTELFNDTIRHTQVYDSTFQKSGNLRSNNAFMKMEMAFMSEPTISYNMLISAKRDAGSGNRNLAARKIGSVVLSMVLNTLLKSIVSAFYKWDDDKTYVENYITDVFNNLISDAGSMVPYVKDFITIFEGYDIERMDFVNISKFADSVYKLTSDSKTPLEKFSDLAGYLADIFGLPGTTIKKNLYAVYNNFISNGADSGIPYEEMIGVVKAGDSAKLSKMYDDLIVAGYKKSTITNGYRTEMAKSIPEISEAAEYLIKGDESNYYSTCRELIDMGFAHDDIKAAVKIAMKNEQEKRVSPIVDFYNAVFNKQNYESIEVPDYINPVFSDMVDAVVDGDTESFTDMYNQLMADGYTESQIKSGYRKVMAEELPEVAEAAKYYKNGEMSNYSITVGKIGKMGFGLTDAKAAVNKYLDIEDVGQSDAEKFAESRISDIGTDINSDSDVVAREELFDGTIYDYDMMYDVLIEQGSRGEDYKAIQQYFLDNGKSRKNLESAMENRAEKTVKKWINAVNAGDADTYDKCLKELTAFYGSQTKAVSTVNKHRSEQENLIKSYLNSSGSRQLEAKEELISEYGDWATAQKAIEYYQKK